MFTNVCDNTLKSVSLPMQNKSKSYKRSCILFFIVAAICNTVWATGGQEFFSEIYDTIAGWMTGYIGGIICLAAIAVGAGFAIVKQSVIFVVPFIAVALILFNATTVVDAMMDATVQDILINNNQIISNGLLK